MAAHGFIPHEPQHLNPSRIGQEPQGFQLYLIGDGLAFGLLSSRIDIHTHVKPGAAKLVIIPARRTNREKKPESQFHPLNTGVGQTNPTEKEGIRRVLPEGALPVLGELGNLTGPWLQKRGQSLSHRA